MITQLLFELDLKYTMKKRLLVMLDLIALRHREKPMCELFSADSH